MLYFCEKDLRMESDFLPLQASQFVTHMNKERMRLYLGNWTENSAIKNNNQAEISTIQHDRIFPYEWMAKFAPLTRQT